MNEELGCISKAWRSGGLLSSYDFYLERKACEMILE
jgi:hypothetical protein